MYLAQGRILKRAGSGKEIIGLHKRLRISWIAERLFGSQCRLYSVEFDSFVNIFRIRCVSYHDSKARPLVADKGEGIRQGGRSKYRTLNRQLPTLDKGWSPSA
jgi:hypothetical protein